MFTIHLVRPVRTVRGLVCFVSARAAQRRLNTARVPAPPRPGRNLGLGREFARPHGLILARATLAVGSHRTAIRAPREIKTPSRPVQPNPKSFLLSLPLLSTSRRKSESSGAAPPPVPSPVRAPTARWTRRRRAVWWWCPLPPSPRRGRAAV